MRKRKKREGGRSTRRISYIHLAAREIYFLRMLINVVRGPRNFEELQTIDGILYNSFQASCTALGLLGDDKEWDNALIEASR